MFLNPCCPLMILQYYLPADRHSIANYLSTAKTIHNGDLLHSLFSNWKYSLHPELDWSFSPTVLTKSRHRKTEKERHRRTQITSFLLTVRATGKRERKISTSHMSDSNADITVDICRAFDHFSSGRAFQKATGATAQKPTSQDAQHVFQLEWLAFRNFTHYSIFTH